jgi:hypothetical protein
MDRTKNKTMKLLTDIVKGIIAMFIAFLISLFLSGCTGKWVWQEGYPKHRTMSFKCPRWNYNEAYDELHHIHTTRQHEPIKVNDRRDKIDP